MGGFKDRLLRNLGGYVAEWSSPLTSEPQRVHSSSKLIEQVNGIATDIDAFNLLGIADDPNLQLFFTYRLADSLFTTFVGDPSTVKRSYVDDWKDYRRNAAANFLSMIHAPYLTTSFDTQAQSSLKRGLDFAAKQVGSLLAVNIQKQKRTEDFGKAFLNYFTDPNSPGRVNFVLPSQETQPPSSANSFELIPEVFDVIKTQLTTTGNRREIDAARKKLLSETDRAPIIPQWLLPSWEYKPGVLSLRPEIKPQHDIPELEDADLTIKPLDEDSSLAKFLHRLYEALPEFASREATITKEAAGSNEYFQRMGMFWWAQRGRKKLRRAQVAESMAETPEDVDEIKILISLVELGMADKNVYRSDFIRAYAGALGVPEAYRQFYLTFDIPFKRPQIV